MGHKTMIGGTAYEVSGGRCLVDGTGYDIKKGRTLVDGTGFDVVFDSPCVVTITGSGSTGFAYVTINGTTYTSAATVEVEAGTVMHCVVDTAYSDVYALVYVNGANVYMGSGGSYTYTIEGDVSVSLSIERVTYPVGGTLRPVSRGVIKITTT